MCLLNSCKQCLSRIRSRSVAVVRRNVMRPRASSVTVAPVVVLPVPVPVPAEVVFPRLAVLRTSDPRFIRDPIVHPICPSCNMACNNNNAIQINSPLRTPQDLAREKIAHPRCANCNVACVNDSSNQETPRPRASSATVAPVVVLPVPVPSVEPIPRQAVPRFQRDPIVHPTCPNCNVACNNNNAIHTNSPLRAPLDLPREKLVHPRCLNCNIACVNTPTNQEVVLPAFPSQEDNISIISSDLTEYTLGNYKTSGSFTSVPWSEYTINSNNRFRKLKPSLKGDFIKSNRLRSLSPIAWSEYTINNNCSRELKPSLRTGADDSSFTSISSIDSSISDSSISSSCSSDTSINTIPDQEDYNIVDIVQEQITAGVERICVTSRVSGRGLQERTIVRSSTVQSGVERKLKVTVDKRNVSRRRCPSVQLTYDEIN